MFDRELDYYGIASTHGIAEHELLVKSSLSFIELLDPSKASRVFFSRLNSTTSSADIRWNLPSRIRIGEGDIQLRHESREEQILCPGDYLAEELWFGNYVKILICEQKPSGPGTDWFLGLVFA